MLLSSRTQSPALDLNAPKLKALRIGTLLDVFHRVRFLRRKHLRENVTAEVSKPTWNLGAEEVEEPGKCHQHQDHAHRAWHELSYDQANDKDRENNGLNDRDDDQQVNPLLKARKSFGV